MAPVPVLTEPPTGHNDLEASFEPAGQPPVWDEAGRAEAVSVATAVITAFADRDQPHQDWWAQVGPLLSIAAQQVYVSVDPANITPFAVTGQGVIVDDTSVYLARVAVPTDIGEYQVLLVRQDAEDSWLVERLVPPEGTGP